MYFNTDELIIGGTGTQIADGTTIVVAGAISFPKSHVEIGENVTIIAEITGDDAEARSNIVLDSVGLADRLGHFPGELSGGQQQRVAIARGIVKNPPLLLCDEPTGALDLETGRTILDLLKSTTAGEDRTVFLVTHNSTIAGMADRVIRLRDGKIVGDAVNENPTPASELRW